MTDLATEPQAEKASNDDVVEADEAVPAADTEEAVDSDEPPAEAPAEADMETVEVAVDSAAATAATDALPRAEEAPASTGEAAPDAAAPVEDGDAVAPEEPAVGPPDSPVYAWAPPEPEPKKSRKALWISAAAGVAVVGLVASSLVLIAPGTTVAGVPVGWLTPGAAADAIEQRLAETTVVLSGDGGDVVVTGAELGAVVDARALADAAFAEHPMWNPTTWFAPPLDTAVELDAEAATEALRAAVPDLYSDPVDATLAVDPATASFVVTPATLGTGIDVDAVEEALHAAFTAGETRVEFDPVAAHVPAGIPTEVADETAARLNGMLDTIGFYVGPERTVPVDRAVAASWLTVTPGDGEFEITADAAAIQPVVDGLAAAVNRAPENAHVITDSGGNVLREDAAGQTGRELGDTQGVAADFAEQLADGNAVFELPVAEVPVQTIALARRIEVNLSEQMAYLYENNNVVDSWYISSGTDGFNSSTGEFRISAKLTSQNMGNRDLTKPPYYFTENVPWVMYYNGDEALHGAYWHNNFGNQMSHGCINMPVGAAEFAYGWAPMGTEVWVHY